jgi:uncharacterized membrane protein
MDKEDIDKNLEFVLYILLGTLAGIVGLVASLFVAYIANYRKLWRIIIGFLIGYIIYLFTLSNLTSTEALVYSFIMGAIAFVMAYIIHKDRSNNK